RELEESRDFEVDDIRLHRPCVELRDVEEAPEEVLHRLNRHEHFLDQLAIARLAEALVQKPHEKTDGVHGLAKVVARGGEEARIRGIRKRELVRALGDALLEPRVRLL